MQYILQICNISLICIRDLDITREKKYKKNNPLKMQYCKYIHYSDGQVNI